VLAILITLSDGGFSRLLIRDIARSTFDRPRVIASLVALRTGWIVVSVVGVVVASLVGPLDLGRSLLFVLLVALALESLAAGFESAAIGAEQPGRVAVGQLLAGVALLAFATVMLVEHFTTALALLGLAVAAGTKLIWQVGAWRAELNNLTPRIRRADAMRWIRQAVPFLIMSVLGTVYYRIDVVILHARGGAAETASYAAAYRVVDAALVISGITAAAIGPHLSRIHRDDPGRIWSEWRRYAGRTAVLATPFVIALIVAAAPIAGFLFGDRYADAAGEDLRLLAPGIAFMLIHTINLLVLFTSDDTRLLLPLSTVLVAMNVSMTWWFVGFAGSAGAAAATSVAELVTVLMFVGLVRWRFRTRAAR